MHQIIAENVPHAYEEALNKMRVLGKEEDSRNGPVLTIPEPVLLSIWNPPERVLTDPERNANPFFHVMETMWMFAGRKDAKWLQFFNSRMAEYADEDGLINGAYGHRWNHHFGFDQIGMAIARLRKDIRTRQAVIAMWDPVFDNRETNDRPCNTTIYFRYLGDSLDMTVCNRSNDLIWGMLGANAVHLTYLHELVCSEVGVPVGTYHVFTNNLHVYKELPNYEAIMNSYGKHSVYTRVDPYPLLHEGETWEQLRNDCVKLVENDSYSPKTFWVQDVARPMMQAYIDRKSGGSGVDYIEKIGADDWRIACYEWVARRQAHAV